MNVPGLFNGGEHASHSTGEYSSQYLALLTGILYFLLCLRWYEASAPRVLTGGGTRTERALALGR